ncbi:hypothetical protein KSP40_PGU010911 [Platanthera guangdongensis]|uniref:Uncharacterized protein n=1 Tax=Platanthera guangdongensis TaxID=2320717 RepID=A0ABR2MR60_9ASPA
MMRIIDGMKEKAVYLGNQKMELTDKLAETELAAALEQKQIQIDKLMDRVEEFTKKNVEFTNLTSLLKQKETEFEEKNRSITNQALAQSKTNDKSELESFSDGNESKGRDELP